MTYYALFTNPELHHVPPNDCILYGQEVELLVRAAIVRKREFKVLLLPFVRCWVRWRTLYPLWIHDLFPAAYKSEAKEVNIAQNTHVEIKFY